MDTETEEVTGQIKIELSSESADLHVNISLNINQEITAPATNVLLSENPVILTENYLQVKLYECYLADLLT